MRRLVVFNNVTLDGYFAGPHGDLSWAHRDAEDAEWNAFIAENAQRGGLLVLGRITYEMMAGYWPTAAAMEADPLVAAGINAQPKVVFSRTLDQAAWQNTTLVAGDPAPKIRKLKQAPGADIVILGSGSLVAQLAAAGLIDEYQVVVHPVVIGQGRTMFEGIPERQALKLTRTRTFGNGNVLLCYEAPQSE